MSKSVRDIIWVSGFIEGEGCFSEQKNCPRLTLASTDLDVIERARDILDKTKKLNVYAYNKPDKARKIIYKLTLVGNISIQWMMTLYPLMGFRRKAKIKELLDQWKQKGISPYGRGPRIGRVKTPNEKFIEIFMAAGHSKEEAEVKTLELLMMLSSKEK